MANQIEKSITNELLPIASNSEPGIASFSEADFLVSNNGVVSAIQKYGIAFSLRATTESNRLVYSVDNYFSNQPKIPKIGNVGIVLKSDVANKNSIGNLVRITSTATDAGTIYYKGQVIGSLLGPKGDVGPKGEAGATGAIQNLVKVNENSSITLIKSFNLSTEAEVGDVCLIVESNDSSGLYKVGDVVNIANVNNTVIILGSLLGNLRGPQGTQYLVGIPEEVAGDDKALSWTPTDSGVSFRIGDYAVSVVSTDGIQRGDVFKIIQIVNGKPMSIKIPTVSVAQLQLGICNLSDSVAGENNTIIFKYSSVVNPGFVPFIGSYGLCIDDNDDNNYGKIFEILSVDERNGTVTTSNVGSSIVGPKGDTGETGPIGPQGIQGPQGPAGPAGVANVTAKGSYSPAETYHQNDLVFFEASLTPNSYGGSYVCNDTTGNGVTGKTPLTAPNEWGFFVAEGAPGPQGPVGPAGAPGTNGVNGLITCVGYKRLTTDGEDFVVIDGTPAVNTYMLIAKSESNDDNVIEYSPGQIFLIIEMDNTGKITDGYSVADLMSPLKVQLGTGAGGSLDMYQRYAILASDETCLLYGGEIYKLYAKTSVYRFYSCLSGVAGNYYNNFINVNTVGTSWNWSFIQKPIANDISYILINDVPETATQGTLTEAQRATLDKNKNQNYIMFYGEKFIPMDIQDSRGYRVYTHHGESDGTKQETSKFIYLTLATNAWSININVAKKMYLHNINLQVMLVASVNSYKISLFTNDSEPYNTPDKLNNFLKKINGLDKKLYVNSDWIASSNETSFICSLNYFPNNPTVDGIVWNSTTNKFQKTTNINIVNYSDTVTEL